MLVILILAWVTLLSALFPDPLAKALESGDYAKAAQVVADYFSEGKNPASVAETIEEVIEDAAQHLASRDEL